MKLEKAKIARLDKDGNPAEEFDVQFNPTTLRLTLSNRVEGGETRGREVRQYIGPSSTTLSLDLIFDTADEGTTANPVSVREKTKKIEQFLIAESGGDKENKPPRIRFRWGDLIVSGVLESLTIDFDLFAANGAPLRAKVPLSIKGQDRAQELNPISDNRRGASTPGLALGGGLGASASAGFGLSASLGVSANVSVALGGESAADFAARVGVDAAAWRGLELGGESSLSLSAGAEIGFSAGLNASAGLGVSVGVEAGVSASLEASFGLEASASLNAVAGVGVGAELASGFALSSGGGVSAALESVQTAKNQAAEQQTRDAFQAPPKSPPAAQTAAAPAAQPKPPEQNRQPLRGTGLPTISAQQAAPPAPPTPRADARASTFGFGVPLRTTVGEAANSRANSLQGDVALQSKISGGEPPLTDDPTTPPWVALPARDRQRQSIETTRQQCGCSACRH